MKLTDNDKLVFECLEATTVLRNRVATEFDDLYLVSGIDDMRHLITANGESVLTSLQVALPERFGSIVLADIRRSVMVAFNNYLGAASTTCDFIYDSKAKFPDTERQAVNNVGDLYKFTASSVFLIALRNRQLHGDFVLQGIVGVEKFKNPHQEAGIHLSPQLEPDLLKKLIDKASGRQKAALTDLEERLGPVIQENKDWVTPLVDEHRGVALSALDDVERLFRLSLHSRFEQREQLLAQLAGREVELKNMGLSGLPSAFREAK